MYELTINTDTFFLTNAFYYDKACEHPCPTIVPLVQGLAGTLRVHFVGELSPEASDSCLFAIRPYRGVDDLYRTEYVNGQVDEDGDVYFDIDLNVSTAELVGALTGREVLDVKAGFVVVNDDQSVRREFQSASTISKTVLAQNETAPLPRATAQSEADYYAAKYVSEWLYCGGLTTCVEKIVATCTAPVKSDIQNLCSSVGQINKNYETLSSDTDTGFANAKTCREQLASEVYACIGNTVETIAGTYATKAEVAGVEIKVNSNTSAIEEEVTRATNAERSLEISIEANASNIEINATAIAALQEQAKTFASEESLNAEKEARESADASLQSAIDANASAISEETTRATEKETTIEVALSAETSAREEGDASLQSAIDAETSRATSAEENLSVAISSVETTATQALTEAQSAGEKASENAETIDVIQKQQTTDEVAIQTNTSDIASLQTQLATDETAISQNTANIEALQGSLTDYATVQALSEETERATARENEIEAKIPDVSGFATTDSLNAEIAERVSADEGLESSIQSEANTRATKDADLCASIGNVKCSLSGYVSLDNAETISGAKTFSSPIYVGSTTYSLRSHGCFADLCGCWRLNCKKIATTDDIPNSGNYVTLDGEQTISGQKYFTQAIVLGTSTEIRIDNCGGLGNLIGCWRINGEAIGANVDTSSYVTLSGDQTISGQKTFSSWTMFNDGIRVGACGTAIERNSSSDYGCLRGRWRYNGNELATTSDIPDASNYVTLDGDQTITGKKLFAKAVSVGPSSSIEIDGTYARLCGNWTYGSQEFATKDDIPDTSSFVTLSGKQTISGVKTFTASVAIGSSSYATIEPCDAGFAILYGCWRLNYEEIAMKKDMPNVCSFVTLGDEQTIKAAKTFTCNIIVNIKNSTEIRIQPGCSYANMWGCWRINGNQVATTNDVVDLTSSQVITGTKTFSDTTTFDNEAVLNKSLYVGTCDYTMGLNSGGGYVCLKGTWRLEGADITTRDVSDALEARIAALEEKVG